MVSSPTLRGKITAFLAEWNIALIFIVWTWSPLLRRLVDWQFGYRMISVIAIFPLLSLLPGFFLLKKYWGVVSRGFRTTFILWILTFGFSFMVAYASGALLPGAYSIVMFLAPAGIAVATLLTSPDPRRAYERTANVFLVCASLASVYAMYQYVSPPPWDTLWLQSEGITSMGPAIPFSLRVFGPYNSSGPFGLYLVFALVLVLPRLRLANWKTTVLIAPILIALLLTEVRAAWLGLALAVIVYLVLAPGRRAPLAALALVGGIFVVFGLVLLSTVHDAQIALQTITDRLTTLQSLSSDGSVVARQGETADSWALGLREPLGLGLGAMSLGARLAGGTGGGIDNGYLSRFVELGPIAWVGYIVALLVSLWTTLAVYARSLRTNRALADIAAVAVTFQVLLLFLEGAFDNHNGLPGMFFWFSLYLSSAVGSMKVSEASFSTVRNREGHRHLPVPGLRTT